VGATRRYRSTLLPLLLQARCAASFHAQRDLLVHQVDVAQRHAAVGALGVAAATQGSRGGQQGGCVSSVGATTKERHAVFSACGSIACRAGQQRTGSSSRRHPLLFQECAGARAAHVPVAARHAHCRLFVGQGRSGTRKDAWVGPTAPGSAALCTARCSKRAPAAAWGQLHPPHPPSAPGKAHAARLSAGCCAAGSQAASQVQALTCGPGCRKADDALVLVVVYRGSGARRHGCLGAALQPEAGARWEAGGRGGSRGRGG
jgi:hypothetical protein